MLISLFSSFCKKFSFIKSSACQYKASQIKWQLLSNVFKKGMLTFCMMFLLAGVTLNGNAENKIMNSQMICMKSWINKYYSIQFSIKSRKMLLSCGGHQIKWFTWVSYFIVIEDSIFPGCNVHGYLFKIKSCLWFIPKIIQQFLFGKLIFWRCCYFEMNFSGGLSIRMKHTLCLSAIA